MKRTKVVIFIAMLLCVIIGAIFLQNKPQTKLKENQIKINNVILTVTSKEEDFDQYKGNHEISFYNNKNSVDIEIKDNNIETYNNIKIGDSIDKLDFCDKSVGMIYYFESQYRSQGYHLEIQYGTDSENIITITYHFYKQ